MVEQPSACNRRSVCLTPIELTSTGIGQIGAESFDAFFAGDHGDAMVRGASDDLLAQERAPRPLIMRNWPSISSAPSRLMSRAATVSRSWT